MRSGIRAVVVFGLFALVQARQVNAGEVRRLTLQDAVQLALRQNRTLKVARLRIEQNRQKKAKQRSDYYPTITNQSAALYISELQKIEIPAGGLGIAGETPIPAGSINLQQGKQTLFSSGTTLSQPLTQLLRVYQRNRIAESEIALSADEEKKAENEIAVQVHTLYYGILVAKLQIKAAEQEAEYSSETLRESEQDVLKGSALKVATIGSRADLLQNQQSTMTAVLQLEDLRTELNDLLGLPLEDQLELDSKVPLNVQASSRSEYLRIALAENPEILAAQETVRKARAGAAIARTAYIPDVTAFARHSYQNGVPFLVHNFGTFGVSLNYDVFDFGKRRAVLKEQEYGVSEAEENLTRLKDAVSVTIERLYNKVERTRTMVNVAQQVVLLRQERERLATNQLEQGVVQIAERKQAIALSYKAQADLLQASLSHLLARAELEQAVGRTPGN